MRVLNLALISLALFSVFNAAAASAASTDHRQLYLLSKPVDSDVALGPLARIAHPVIVASSILLKAAVLYTHTGEPLSLVSLLAYEILKSPAALAADSSVDISVRQWWRKRAMLQEVAKIPGVARILVLTSGSMQFEGPLASRKKNTGFIFVESDTPLENNAPWTEKFGQPIRIENVGDTRVQLSLKLEGEVHAVMWETTLKDIFEKQVMPENVEQAWTEGLQEFAAKQSFLPRYVTHSHEKTGLEVDATLLLPDGEKRALGVLIQGKGVRKLLGLGLLKRASKYVQAQFLGRPVTVTQAIPLCERILNKAQYPRDPI